ncbi:MAG: hypothetical protein WAQ32_07285 [Dethiobacteria bacterium]|jgi:hypothetical protein|nr:hypothetical protein [Bacillota bacterium]NMD32373.1 hypothetical protein [Bacillota bacterium]HOB29249.1 hypothetical protein [Bacillota bacterium]HPZ41861.1 hypothetical protein [Bacillota bacterium]HQD52699.1 hypothetical protein [Bacillota bacterium]
MRELGVWLGLVLSVLVLLYGGLNLVERSIGEIMGAARRHEAFLICGDLREGVGVTFAGRTVRLHVSEICVSLKQWLIEINQLLRGIFMR